MEDRTISVFGREGEDESGGLTRELIKLSDYLYERRDVEASTLRSRIAEFLESMKLVMENIPSDFGNLHLDSITITAEVSTKGQVSLLGAGGEFGGKGGISFTLKHIPELARGGSQPPIG